MNEPIYQSKSFLTKLSVFSDYIELKSFGVTQIIPIGNISDLQNVGFTNQIVLFMNNGKKVKVYPKDQKKFLIAVSNLLGKKY